MYPMHKLTPTPFGTYLLYMDQEPNKYKLEKYPYQKPKAHLPTYNKVKEYGRRNNLTNNLLVVQAYLMNEPRTTDGAHQHKRYAPKREVYTADNPLWRPQAKSRHRSYNMRYLWHSGQPIAETPAEVIRYTDDVTGATVTPYEEWYQHRARIKAELDDGTSYGYETRNTSMDTITTKRSSRKEHRQHKTHHRHHRRHHRKSRDQSLPSVFSRQDKASSPIKMPTHRELRNENKPNTALVKEKMPSRSRNAYSASSAVTQTPKPPPSSELVERIKTTMPSHEKSCFPSINSPTKRPDTRTTSPGDDDQTTSRISTASTAVKSRRSRMRDKSRMQSLPPIPENGNSGNSPDVKSSTGHSMRPDAVTAIKREQSMEFKSVSPKYPSPVQRQSSKIMEEKRNIVTGRELLPFKWQSDTHRPPQSGRKSAVVDTTNPEAVMREMRKFEEIEKMRAA